MKSIAKKTLSLALVLIMVFQMLATVVFAVPAFQATDYVSNDETTLYVNSDTALAGGIIDVDIMLENNKGLSSLKLNVHYDDALELIDVSFNSLVNATATSPVPYSNPQTVSLINPMENFEFNGAIATLKFKVREDIANGYCAGIVIECDSENTFDYDFNEVFVNTLSGNITVYKSIPGDMDGDRKLTNRDAIQLFRFVSNWNIDLSKVNTDLNGDGKTNNIDCIMLFRKVAGWDVEFALPQMCAHELTENERQEPSCTKDGRISYYTCKLCKESFADEKAKEKITPAETVIFAKGHTEITDKSVAPTIENTGLTEGSHCGECGEILVPQKEIPKLKAAQHSITYRNIKNATVPEKYHTYTEGKILELPQISSKGYKFVGWFTSSVGGEIVDQIDTSYAKDISVYARWELEEYKITYFDATINTNVKTYTIEDTVILSDPEKHGLLFVGWSGDERVKSFVQNGKTYYKIEAGTTGDIEITANWRVYRNLVSPAKENKVKFFYDKELERYFIISEIGTVQNVIIGKICDDYCKTTALEKVFSASETYTVGKSTAEEISDSISESLSKTDSWSDVNTFINSEEFTESSQTTVGLTTGEQGKVQGAIEGQLGFDSTVKNEWQYHCQNGKETGNGFEKTKTSSSSIAYTSQMTTGSENTFTIFADMPNGYYVYAKTVDIRVFAVIVYDPVTDSCKGATHCVITNLSQTPLYFEDKTDVYEETAIEGLEYSISVDEIKGIISNSYYVEYASNGGEGKMKTEGFPVDSEQALAKSEFTRVGFTQTGWEAVINGKTEFLEKEQTVKNLAPKGEKITLKAVWKPNSYKVSFDANGGIVSTPTKDVEYLSTYGMLPAPTRTGYVFNGWTLGKNLITENTVVNTPAQHTLTAKWSPVSYTVSYHPNGGIGTMGKQAFEYDEKKPLSKNAFTREKYDFIGWATAPNGSVVYKDSAQLVNATQQSDGEIKLYAIWLKTFETVGYLGREIRINKGQTHKDYPSPNFNVSALKANGYTHIKVKIVFDAKRTALICYNYAHLTVHANGKSNELVKGIYFNNSSYDKNNTVWWNIPLENCNSNGMVQLDWWSENAALSGKGDGFYLGTTTVTFEAN